MPSEILDSNTQTDGEITDCGDQIEIFESEDEMRRSLTHFCYGDLYVIGRLWIEALKTALVGTKLSLIPVVSAAKCPEPPQKPPPMKYTDLPLYKSPHLEYKDYIQDKEKCPKSKVRIMHTYLLPKVKCFRRDFQKKSCEAKCALLSTCCNAATSFNNKKKDFKKMMRDPENLSIRQAVVLAGGATGFLIGSGKGIPRRFFYTGLGVLSTGALCFPKETDAGFREFTYYSGKLLIAFYNSMCGKHFSLRERMPCKEDLPPPVLPRKPQCPPKPQCPKKK
ncbi:uncharacterized protein [Epargyreus clarus]|uniref:uncharacterized protein n=1 Tax=Epargyreus clarus TaxID=520877 RepID=UPI003C2E5919